MEMCDKKRASEALEAPAPALTKEPMKAVRMAETPIAKRARKRKPPPLDFVETEYSADDLAIILADDEQIHGYGGYSRDFLRDFFECCAQPMTVSQAISELQEDGYFPDCQLCGFGGEDALFLTGELNEIISVADSWMCICAVCHKKIVRKVGGICRSSGLQGGLAYSDPNLWHQFFEYAVLDRMTKQAAGDIA